MKFPKISEVASVIKYENQSECQEEEGIDIRLQVCEGGSWLIHTGDSSYDQDHRGYWGASSIPGNNKRINSREVAKDLISQAEEQYYTDKNAVKNNIVI